MKKGFTLIELLAVIIILGILMLIAIPSVTKYINNSRKNTYVDTAQELIKGAQVLVNSGELDMFDQNTTYYIPISAIETESGTLHSPYGKFAESYVVVTYDGDNYDYYYVGRDEADMGIPTPIKDEKIESDSIIPDVKSVNTDVGIGRRDTIRVYNDDCSDYTDSTASYHISVEGASNNQLPLNIVCKKATELHTTKCNRTQSRGCRAAGFSYGQTITYGTIPEGTPKGGDAYDCDVNADGVFDSTIERFYYLTSQGNNSTLLYYKNYNDTEKYKYSYIEDLHEMGLECTNTTFGCSRYGPVTSAKYLPTTQEWSNPRLISPGVRQIYNEKGETVVNEERAQYEGLFQTTTISYEGKAARLLTTQEVEQGCATLDTAGQFVEGELDQCVFLLENVGHFTYNDENDPSNMYWLETPIARSSYAAYYVQAYYRWVYGMGVHSTGMAGVRPVITVLTSDIEQ